MNWKEGSDNSSGSAHNFLDPAVITKVGLLVQPTKSITVKMANGNSMLCEGRSDRVAFRVQGYHFSTEPWEVVMIY